MLQTCIWGQAHYLLFFPTSFLPLYGIDLYPEIDNYALVYFIPLIYKNGFLINILVFFLIDLDSIYL